MERIFLLIAALVLSSYFTFSFAQSSEFAPGLISSKIFGNVTKKVIITPIAGQGGRIEPSSPITVDVGANIMFKAFPNRGYSVKEWLLDEVVVANEENKYVLVNATSNHTVKVNFTHTNVLIAAGYQNEQDKTSPFMIISTDSGNHWIQKEIKTGSSASGQIKTVSCVKNVVTPLCVIGGEMDEKPLLAISLDGGYNWQIPDTDGMPLNGKLTHASCFGKDHKESCVLIGESTDERTENLSTFLIVISDKNSKPKVEQGLPQNTSFTGISCSGSIPDATCVIVGNRTNEYTSPMIGVSDGNVSKWIIHQIDDARLGTLHAVKCTGQAPNVFCAAVGEIEAKPLIVLSKDAGKHWYLSNVAGNGKLDRLSCLGDSINGFCVARQVEPSSTKNFIRTLDTGKHWEHVILSDECSGSNYDYAWYNTISCTGNNFDRGVCVAGGGCRDKYDEYDIVSWSTDSLTTWLDSYRKGSGEEDFEISDCTGTDSNAICVLSEPKYPNPTFLVLKKGLNPFRYTLNEFNDVHLNELVVAGISDDKDVFS